MLDKSSSVPLYRQLYLYISSEIDNGSLAMYEKIPSRRELSKALGLGKNTVDTAYQMLVADGYLCAVERSGYYVCAGSYDRAEAEVDPNADYKYNFSLHNFDITHIPYNKWNRAISGIKFSEPSLLGPGNRYGEFELRSAVSKLMYELHGIKCSPHNIVIGAGTEYLLLMLNKIFAKNNIYGFETPCYLNHYDLLKNTADIFILNSGQDGINTDLLERSDISTLYLIPDHNIPTGLSMPLSCRQKILEWAYNKNGYIIENGAGNTFMDPNIKTKPIFVLDKNQRVIYMQAFSRLLAPDIRMAFMILPDELMEKWKKTNTFYRCLVSKYEQAIILEFINRGYLTEHIT